MIKIISKKQYDKLIKLLKEAYVIVKNLNEENTKLKSDLKELQTENSVLKEAMRTKTLYVDFPATKKLHEDKNY